MGRIGGWFKKSDEKEKSASNPYAQQPPVTQQQPVGQHSPPPGYDQYSQYNGNQYNANQNLPQARQGPSYGLPAGPRPGGFPSPSAQGPARTGTWESNKTAPPEYNEQHGHNSPPPTYDGSPSLGAAGRSPAPSSYQNSPSFAPGRGTPTLSSAASPPLGTGYPREKYGTSDAVGGNRFDQSGVSQQGNTASLPSQRQGGYGNLDTGRDALFGNYKGPSQQAFGPNSPQTGAMDTVEQPPVDTSNMTEEEREEYNYQGIRSDIKRVNDDTIASGYRSLARLAEIHRLQDDNSRMVTEQDERLANASAHMRQASK